MIQILEEQFDNNEIKINFGKTKKENHICVEEIVTFKYLGSIITYNGKVEEDVNQDRKNSNEGTA